MHIYFLFSVINKKVNYIQNHDQWMKEKDEESILRQVF